MFIDEKRVVSNNDCNADYETIMIEISLAEYRHLVHENTRMECEITNLHKENDVLKSMR